MISSKDLLPNNLGMQSISQPQLNKTYKKDDELRQAAKDFESYIGGYMMEVMFQDIPSGIFGDESSEQMFRPLLLQEYAKKTEGLFGLAEPVYQQLKRIHEVSEPKTTITLKV